MEHKKPELPRHVQLRIAIDKLLTERHEREAVIDGKAKKDRQAMISDTTTRVAVHSRVRDAKLVEIRRERVKHEQKIEKVYQDSIRQLQGIREKSFAELRRDSARAEENVRKVCHDACWPINTEYTEKEAEIKAVAETAKENLHEEIKTKIAPLQAELQALIESAKKAQEVKSAPEISA